jgi:hypothetical protein
MVVVPGSQAVKRQAEAEIGVPAPPAASSRAATTPAPAKEA